MANCKNCGNELLEGRKFCSNCGTPAQDADLSGAVLSEDVKPENESAAAEAVSSVPVQQAPPVAVPAPVYVQQIPVAAPEQNADPVGVWGWIGVFVLGMLPLINLIMLIVWACGGTKKLSLRNYSRAALICSAIMIVVFIILAVLALVLGASFWGNYSPFNYGFRYW